MRRWVKEPWIGASGGFGADNRRARRIERARRKEVIKREIRESNTVGDPPFTRCLGCGARYCDGC